MDWYGLVFLGTSPETNGIFPFSDHGAFLGNSPVKTNPLRSELYRYHKAKKAFEDEQVRRNLYGRGDKHDDLPIKIVIYDKFPILKMVIYDEFPIAKIVIYDDSARTKVDLTDIKPT